MHDDDGVFTTALAMGHIKLGLRGTRASALESPASSFQIKTLGTRAHNFQVDTISGEIVPYPNHPAGLGLVMAIPISIFGPNNRAVIRLAPVLFHFLTLALLVLYIRKTYGDRQSLVAAYCLAIIPMSSFLARTVYCSPFVLPAMVIFVLTYFRLLAPRSQSSGGQQARQGRVPLLEGQIRAKDWILLVAASLWGSQMDWPFYFALWACLVHALIIYGTTKEKKYLKIATGITLLGLLLAALNIAHAWLAFGHYGIARVLEKFQYATHPEHHGWTEIAGKALDFLRRYFTEVVFLAAFFYLYLRVKECLIKKTLEKKDQIILIFFAIGLCNLVATRTYIRTHHYSGFYLIPFMTLAFIEVLQWLKTKYTMNFKKIQATALILITISSAITLKIRHTRLHDYSIKIAQDLRHFM